MKSIRYRGWMYQIALLLFAISFVALGYLGLQPATPTYIMLARVFTVVYFAFFILMPWYTSGTDQAGAGAGDASMTEKMRALLAALALLVLRVRRWREEAGDVDARGARDITNRASLQRGANFVNYCMGCHSARYVRLQPARRGPRPRPSSRSSTT